MKRTAEARRRIYRAPQYDGGILIDPPLSSSTLLLHRNSQTAQNSVQIYGEELATLKESVRDFAFREAIQYTQQYADVAAPKRESQTPWIVSGHQPELFHPGVWFKNHLLDHLRQKHSAVALHVIVDNDLCTKSSVQVPTGSLSNPMIENVAYDDPAEAIPHEERSILNREAFKSFGSRSAKVLRPLIGNPMIREHWHRAEQAVAAPSIGIGIALSRIRHEIEKAWGSQTIEVPLSRLCASREFLVFFLHFVRHCATFVETYNAALSDYRKANRIRSRSHPVPALSVEDDWYELPFWVWQTSDPRRKRLFVRSTQNAIELTDRSAVWRLSDASKTDCVLEQIIAMMSDGVKIRPRALMTTLFCRLLLSDLFIHGIGGAKYDELTDEICRRMGLKLPQFVCATATFRLPLDIRSDGRARIRTLRESLRATRFHPERFIAETDDHPNQVSKWVAAKRHWIGVTLPRGHRKQRHEKISQANLELLAAIQTNVTQLQQELNRAKNDRRVADRLGSREFSFLLFPESHLRSRMTCDFCGG